MSKLPGFDMRKRGFLRSSEAVGAVAGGHSKASAPGDLGGP